LFWSPFLAPTAALEARRSSRWKTFRPTSATLVGNYSGFTYASGFTYTAFLEDRDLKTRRELFTYGRDTLYVLWSSDSKAFAVADDLDGDISRCKVFSVDEKVPPIPVLDLIARQLSETEREDLEVHLIEQHVGVQALKWIKATDLELDLSGYGGRDRTSFCKTYILPVDFHAGATAPIWPK
jgi:hypothetical protein